jgi:hypothetical protein
MMTTTNPTSNPTSDLHKIFQKYIINTANQAIKVKKKTKKYKNEI